jgi:putative nucleotidyltransferase with HDIG domain
MPIDQIIESLPPLPLTVANVIKVTTNPDHSAEDLMKAVLPDQTMCAAILKIANSVLYGHSQKISSLQSAIVLLGINEVQSIVMGKAAISTFRSLFKENKKELAIFWDHSFVSGLAAKIIAENLGLVTGQFFMAGLLHDIGKLVMFLALSEQYTPKDWMIPFTSGARLEEEKARFSVSHDVVGARLLRKWLFPESLILALEYHHHPEDCSLLHGYPLVVQLADMLAFICCNDNIIEEQSPAEVVDLYLPDIREVWERRKMKWDPVMIESWLAWLKIDREYGSSIINVLSL